MHLKTSEMSWDLDFVPRHNGPSLMPVVALKSGDGIIWAVSGFERRTLDAVHVLILESSAGIDLPTLMADMWDLKKLAPCEALRFQKVLGITQNLNNPLGSDFVLDWPLELQNFFDDRSMSIKTLRPLKYLLGWGSLAETLLKLQPTSSQTREILDLLCDLKTSGQGWTEVTTTDASAWLLSLKGQRFPKTLAADQEQAQKVQQISWPRGVHAKWERHGDQAGVTLQTKITTPVEWEKLKNQLSHIQWGESFWKT